MKKNDLKSVYSGPNLMRPGPKITQTPQIRCFSPNSLSCKGFLRCFQRRLGQSGRAPVHSLHIVGYQAGAHFICKYTEKVNMGLRKPCKLQGFLRQIVRKPSVFTVNMSIDVHFYSFFTVFTSFTNPTCLVKTLTLLVKNQTFLINKLTFLVKDLTC